MCACVTEGGPIYTTAQAERARGETTGACRGLGECHWYDGANGNGPCLTDGMQAARVWLGDLPPATAQRIAWRNAAEPFGVA